MKTYSTIVKLTPSLRAVQGYVCPDLRILKKLRELIDQSFWWNRSSAYYTGKLGLSLKSLNNITRFYLNKTVHELLQNRIHTEAEYLLQCTAHSVKEITYMLGCSDTAYFCRCFKQKTGKTPKQWRKEIRATQSAETCFPDHGANAF